VKNLKLSQDENLSIKISDRLLPQAYQQIDLYFSLPVEMGINSSTLDAEDYFYSNIKSHSAYFSDKIHLPLVRSRFISKRMSEDDDNNKDAADKKDKKEEKSDYRLNLNLYSYQLKIALDADIKDTLKLKTAEEFYPAAVELSEQTAKLIKKLRRYKPSDISLKSFYQNADNFLSWHIEQSFLKLLSKGPKGSSYSAERELLINFCRAEGLHRADCKYNSETTLDDPNRITNKMRLLQRLTEYGVVFNKKTRYLDRNLMRLVKGCVTAVMMAFVMLLVLNARSNYTEVTLALVALLGLIYGLRETFKEDMTSFIWRKIQKGRPKWQNVFSQSAENKKILRQTLWCEYIKNKDLPDSVNALLQKRRQQNKQAAHLLHFRCDCKVLAKAFLPGYDKIQLQIFFNLTPFVRYLKRGAGRLYNLDGQKISNQSVERRYQINLIVRTVSEEKSDKKERLQRFKITLNRSEIVNIETMPDSA
jgi:hypothetical protein